MNGCGFESQHEIWFVMFLTKNIPEEYFFKHQNQLRPMSIISHMGGADLGRSRLVSSCTVDGAVTDETWLKFF